MSKINEMWWCFDTWNLTARNGFDKRQALRCKVKALILMDKAGY